MCLSWYGWTLERIAKNKLWGLEWESLGLFMEGHHPGRQERQRQRWIIRCTECLGRSQVLFRKFTTGGSAWNHMVAPDRPTISNLDYASLLLESMEWIWIVPTIRLPAWQGFELMLTMKSAMLGQAKLGHYNGGHHKHPLPITAINSGEDVDKKEVPACSLGRCKKNKSNLYPRRLWFSGMPTWSCQGTGCNF